MDINEILSTEGSIHLWLYSSMVVSSPRGDGEPQGRPVAYVSPCAHTPGQAPSAKRTFRVERSSDPAGRRDASTISATHAAGDRLIYGVFGMAVELNSSNFSQFSSQTFQLQNSMEMSTPWSCSANESGVLEHLFCCSKTNLGSRVVPCRRAGRDGVAVSRPQRGAPTQPNQGKKQAQGRAPRHAAGPPRRRTRITPRTGTGAPVAHVLARERACGAVVGRPTWWRRPSLCHPPPTRSPREHGREHGARSIPDCMRGSPAAVERAAAFI